MFRVVFLTLALSTAALAQTAPGTFNAVTPEHIVGSTLPLVSTPTLTLSNGFTPATVTMPQSMVVEQPQAFFVNGELPQGEGAIGTPNMGEPAGDFNFASVSPESAFNFGMSGPSLGEVARRYTAGHVRAHKTYTNEDIDRMTSELPENGILAAKFSNGQPIVDRNGSGFSPMSGIANMPEVTNNPEGTELATRQANPTDQNPAGEIQNATASNGDQGQAAGQQATMPSTDASQRNQGNSANQQIPASDNPR